MDNDEILWLNEKHIKEGLDHKNLREITTRYISDYRNHIHELAEESKKQVSRIFIDENC